MRIKICGITNAEDALLCAEAGADALGFIFVPGTPRCINAEQAASIVRKLPPLIAAVGVFMDQDPGFINECIKGCGLDLVQLHGREDTQTVSSINSKVIKRFNIKSSDSPEIISSFMTSYPGCFHLLDPGSGSGIAFDWEKLDYLSGRFIVAGGLTPDNVGEMVRKYRPWAVDTCSGVELEPGKKDGQKVIKFIREARCAWES